MCGYRSVGLSVVRPGGMSSLCHAESFCVTSVEEASWPGHPETGLYAVSLSQLSSREMFTVVIYVHSVCFIAVVVGEPVAFTEGRPCLCPFRNKSVNNLAVENGT